MAAACHASNTTTTTASSSSEDPNKKIRKPYTITKSRESWTELEHDKFLEALQLFDRDWKKIEAFVGSKTVIQIRSHAQKYFMKLQKNGTNGHVPPPRPKRKATHPYPHKASKNGQNMELSVVSCLENLSAPMISQSNTTFQSSFCPLELGYALRTDSSSMVRNCNPSASLSFMPPNTLPPASASHKMTDVIRPESPGRWPTHETSHQGNQGPPLRVMPDFAQIYTLIGSVFDPNSSGHLQKLKEMDPIEVDAALSLMKNLAINLSSPNFEEHQSKHAFDWTCMIRVGSLSNMIHGGSLGTVLIELEAFSVQS